MQSNGKEAKSLSVSSVQPCNWVNAGYTKTCFYCGSVLPEEPVSKMLGDFTKR